jgi:hypothetical protein
MSATNPFDSLGVKDLAVMLRSGTTPVVASWGLGVDSTAVLLRYMFEPECRDFDLQDLIVVTAHTGDEWERTRTDVEAHMLPLLAAHGIRYIQVARSQRLINKRTNEGIAVLDDSTSPTKLYLEGVYKLSDEMFENGTIPQSGGIRKCSMHAKGEVLDPTIARVTDGRPFRHIMGFESTEVGRAKKDTSFSAHARYDGKRTAEYPLIEWGWDRAKCEAYILEKTGVDWSKSACMMCPFAMTSKASRAVIFDRFETEEPEGGTMTLFMEHIALALNPKQGLVGGQRLVDLAIKEGHPVLVDRLQAYLATQPMALYEVKRILKPDARSLVRLAEGTKAEMEEALLAKAIETGADLEVGSDGFSRAYLRRREDRATTVEHFYTIAPAVPVDKQEPNFPTWWRKYRYQADNRAKVRAYRAAQAAQALAS